MTDAGAPGIARADITGLVLAGGRGSRMGGVDKGLRVCGDKALALRALQRLAPQVGSLAVNANRHAEAYAAFGVPVWPDATSDFDGPLAGLLAGLDHCTTPWLATVPCDAPLFPTDLVTRLALGVITAGADLAFAATEVDGQRHAQPVFCLMRRSLRDTLARDLRAGARKVEAWVTQQRCVALVFDDAGAFANANTLDELQRLAASGRP